MNAEIRVFVLPAGGTIFEFAWPSQWRLPIEGELLLTDRGQFQVQVVQFEFEDGEPAVQLRVEKI